MVPLTEFTMPRNLVLDSAEAADCGLTPKEIYRAAEFGT
jgi:hypothetical protein